MEWTKKYKKAVTFSYDDGIEQDLRLLEILNKYGLKCTFNLNTGLDSSSPGWMCKDLAVRRMDLDKHVADYAGHEIAVHALTHPGLCELSDEEIKKELLEDRENIKKLFGQDAVGMAYPYGAYSEWVMEKLREFDFKYARGVESSHSFDVQENLLAFKPTCHHDDELLFELAERFLSLETEEPQIFYIWGHSYELEGNKNWDRFEEFCKLISGREDIFYGTNREVLL